MSWKHKKGKIINLKELVEYANGGVINKQVLKNEAGNITLFSFNKGQGLTEHTASFDAMLEVLDEEVEIKIDNIPHNLNKRDIITMPSTNDIQRFKLLLTMIKV